MEDHLKEQFISAMLRFKKVDMTFPTECEIQIVEMMIMQSIADCCLYNNNNLDVITLQKRLHISKPAVSQTLNTLEKKGYIVREIDSCDRRKIAIAITPTGLSCFKQSKHCFEGTLTKVVERFGKDNMLELIQHLNRLSEIYTDLKSEGVDGLI